VLVVSPTVVSLTNGFNMMSGIKKKTGPRFLLPGGKLTALSKLKKKGEEKREKTRSSGDLHIPTASLSGRKRLAEPFVGAYKWGIV
jgi:hypothetical protein